MICPYCNVEYETHAPCFCHPAPQAVAAAPETGKPALKEERLPPTGLDNPFWKPEVTLPSTLSPAPVPPRGRPGFSV